MLSSSDYIKMPIKWSPQFHRSIHLSQNWRHDSYWSIQICLWETENKISSIVSFSLKPEVIEYYQVSCFSCLNVNIKKFMTVFSVLRILSTFCHLFEKTVKLRSQEPRNEHSRIFASFDGDGNCQLLNIYIFLWKQELWKVGRGVKIFSSAGLFPKWLQRKGLG